MAQGLWLVLWLLLLVFTFSGVQLELAGIPGVCLEPSIRPGSSKGLVGIGVEKQTSAKPQMKVKGKPIGIHPSYPRLSQFPLQGSIT